MIFYLFLIHLLMYQSVALPEGARGRGDALSIPFYLNN